MCVIMVCHDKKPSHRDLELAVIANRDGIGLMYLNQEGKAEWQKGLVLPELKHTLKTLPLPFAIHFRFATSGGVSQALTHPFPLTEQVDLHLRGAAERVMMHNGMYPDWKEECRIAATSTGTVVPSGAWSDTRGLAWLGALLGHDYYALVTDRIVVLDAPTQQFLFYGEGWTEENGISYSNLYFRPMKKEKYVKPICLLPAAGAPPRQTRWSLRDLDDMDDMEWQRAMEDSDRNRHAVERFLKEKHGGTVTRDLWGNKI